MSKPFYEVGRYACKIVNQALGEAKTGTPQFALQFTVMGKVDQSDPTRFIPAPAQYERTHYRAITEKTIEYFMDDLKSLGFQGQSFRDLDPASANFHDFRGQDVDMWCAHENGQDGQPREKWGVARQGGSSFEVKPIEPKKLRDLDNMFGKHLKNMRSPGSSAPATRSAPANAAAPPDPMAITDDDVPF